jgi:hypothetical protein
MGRDAAETGDNKNMKYFIFRNIPSTFLNKKHGTAGSGKLSVRVRYKSISSRTTSEVSHTLKKKRFARVRLITINMQFQVITAINCRASTSCMNVNYVGHKQASSLLFKSIYSMFTDILAWIRGV